MPFTRVTTLTRPSTIVPFFIIADDVLQHLSQAHGLNSKRVYSEDELVVTVTDVFDTQEDLDNLNADPIIRNWLQEMDEYNKNYEIVRESVVTETE